MQVTLTLSDEQAYTLMETLEFYSRIQMGQFEEIDYRLHMNTYDEMQQFKPYDRELAKAYLESARQIIFNSPGGAYTGINHTSERSKIAWDIYQQLRHDITVYKNPVVPIDQRGRAYNRVFKTSNQELPKVQISD